MDKLVELRARAIQRIENAIASAELFLQGRASLEKINAAIPDPAEHYPNLEAVAQPILQAAHCYIQFAVDLGLLERERDRELLAAWDRRLGT